jgi:putative phosphoribosyl transferase
VLADTSGVVDAAVASMDRFHDRREAGILLARALSRYAGRCDVIVLGLPRGGVPVAYEVATALDAPLDVLVVRKIGVPGHEEVAMGALASGGIQVMDPRRAEQLGVSKRAVRACIEAERVELERCERVFRGGREHLDLAGRTVILVDDGLATGSSMYAAVAAVGTRRPGHVVVAVPVGAPEVCRAFRTHADDVVCLETADPLHAVGLWYEDFSRTPDAEVRALLDRAAERRAAAARRVAPSLQPR